MRNSIDLVEEFELPVEFFVYDRTENETVDDVECLFYNAGVGELYDAYKNNRKEEDLNTLIKRCIDRLTEHQKEMKEELLKRKDPEYSNEENQYIDVEFADFIFAS